MTITNFDRFRLERQQKQKSILENSASRKPQQASPMLLEQAQNSSPHYRDPRRLHATQEAHSQAATRQREERTNMSESARPSRHSSGMAGPGAPTSLRSSSMTRHYQSPHQMRTLVNQQVNKPQQQQQQIQQEVWTSTEDLFWDHMREVQNKWNTLKLNDDIWAKLIYFERNRRLAKAYVSTPVLTVDGSTNGLDGFRIGLSGIENSYRDLDSMACLCSIGHGIKLKIDSQGNILIRKLSPPGGQQQHQQQAQQQSQSPGHKRSCSIWIKEWPATAPPNHSPSSGGSSGASSASSDYSQLSGASSRLSGGGGGEPSQCWPMYELLDARSSYKLFDMQKFRARLERSQREAESQAAAKKRTSAAQIPIDWRQCVSIISFVRSINMGQDQPPPDGATGEKSANKNNNNSKSAPNSPGQQQVLSDPCWLMLINIIAIDMLKSSVCDITSRPSPGSQTSALINRHQHEHQHERGLVARRPAASLARPASSSRLAQNSSSSSSDSAANKQTRAPAAGSGQQLRRGPGDAPTSNRNQASLSSSSTSSSTATAARLLASRQSSQPQLSQATATDGSIYTTFTGKYLDKQQRMRLNKQARPLGALGGGSLLHPGSSVDDLRAIAAASARHSRHDPSLYPVHPLPATTFTILQRQQQRERYGRLVPLVTGGGAQRPRRASQALGGDDSRADQRPQLSHSLSAFDLSHGLKLNLRSLNSTSIRMNFSDSESEREQDEQEFAREAKCHYRESQVGSGEREREQQVDLKDQEKQEAAALPAKKKVSMARKAFERLNGETSPEWTSLAKKFSMLNFKPIESTGTGQQQQQRKTQPEAIQKVSGTNEGEEANTAGANGSELQQNASRASIVSSSSSSGCPDNDYVISQSSNSSMSTSSTRSHGEEPFSQPASSSGINCASANSGGNTSDEYERQAQERQASPEDGQKEVANQARPKGPSHNTGQSEDAHQKASGAERQTLNATTTITNQTRTRATQQARVNQLSKRDKAASKLTRKQNISLNRCYNVKTIDFSDNELDSSGACGDAAHHLSGGQLYHGTTNGHSTSSSLRRQPPTMQLCDCGQPECDQYLVAVGATDGGAPCDCCCDCFYIEEEDALSPLPACCDGGGVAMPAANLLIN